MSAAKRQTITKHLHIFVLIIQINFDAIKYSVLDRFIVIVFFSIKIKALIIYTR